jgi:hypothetical protein
MSAVLESTTLQDLVERQETKERAIASDMKKTSKGAPDGEPDR